MVINVIDKMNVDIIIDFLKLEGVTWESGHPCPAPDKRVPMERVSYMRQLTYLLTYLLQQNFQQFTTLKQNQVRGTIFSEPELDHLEYINVETLYHLILSTLYHYFVHKNMVVTTDWWRGWCICVRGDTTRTGGIQRRDYCRSLINWVIHGNLVPSRLRKSFLGLSFIKSKTSKTVLMSLRQKGLSSIPYYMYTYRHRYKVISK